MECLKEMEGEAAVFFKCRAEGKRPCTRSERWREKAMLQRGREVRKAQVRAERLSLMCRKPGSAFLRDRMSGVACLQARRMGFKAWRAGRIAEGLLRMVESVAAPVRRIEVVAPPRVAKKAVAPAAPAMPVPGEKFTARVKGVYEGGMFVTWGDGRFAGNVSGKCWGEGESRAKKLAAYAKGQKIEVEMRSYNPENRCASLVLPGFGSLAENADSPQTVQKTQPVQKAPVSRKPDYAVTPKTSLLLIDAANVMGHLSHECAAMGLVAVAGQLKAQGYRAIFFIDEKARQWARYPLSESDKATFDAFCAGRNASVVPGEADLPMLQIADLDAGAVIVSNDRFRDYRGTYGSIVGTSRVKTFSVADIGDQTVVSVVGLPRGLAVGMAAA